MYRARKIEPRMVELGSGVFATQKIIAGEKIIEFKGTIYSSANEPPEIYDEVNHFLQIGKDTFLGPSGDLDDLFNHSCDPNAAVLIGDSIELIAIKDINKDEEITFDYSTTIDEDGNWSMKCACGAANCRKIISDFKFIPKDIQARYIQLGIIPQYILDNL